jgi:D-apiose dehydrogenase
MTKPRVALIGCGFFARNHMQAWADVGADVVAVCDIDPQKAAAFAHDFCVAAQYADATAMLAATRPDVVDIATTVAETLEDAAAMVATCSGKGSTLLVHENFRWQKPFRALKATMAEIGVPQFLRLSFRHGYDIYANQPYLAKVADLALTDVGLHLFDLARFLMGDIANVHCRTQRLNPQVAGQDAFLASLGHVSGAVSSVECSFFTQAQPDPFPQTLARIEGDRGTLELTAGYRLIRHRSGAAPQDVEPDVPVWGAKPWHGIQDSVVAFQAHVLEVLAGRAEPQPSGAHNLETLAVTLAAIRSARSARVEQIGTALP